MSQISRGLENVFIKTTALTYIDGENGILRYGGYDIEDLVEHTSFEEVIHLMLYGDLPTKLQLQRLKASIDEAYEIPQQVLDMIYSLPRDSDAVGMMETAFSALSSIYGMLWNKSTNRDNAIKLIARASTVVANVLRAKEGKKPVIPEPSESFAKSFLRASFSRTPTIEEVKAMDASLILYADHEVPASTTAALVTSSTLSDIYSCVVAALAALKGPLHGGAAEEAFKQFVEIGEPEMTETWFKKKVIEQKSRLMGFGHRVYKTYDPRAKIFKKYAKLLSEKSAEARKFFEIAQKVEELGVENFSEKHIYPNTDFYSGIVFYSLGFPVYMFTSLFALSRTLGWTAHVIEYVEDQHRLIRPRALYVGPIKREVVPMELRG
ncbi:citrate synthase [Metallosphaera hakonensis]|uniref:Citrate synthase n=1 Tax=Metallosphaera hakonensis JCM 8857 = DSM 7519 TaxID=1293036 RepID=A0A2U9IX61_9CREN|nr:citrate synthase [Metallosphaera hakonensis]AWS00573.1 citrate synthase [Metallosphaera hakonensis JCM 8857 = DSM 7519]